MRPSDVRRAVYNAAGFTYGEFTRAIVLIEIPKAAFELNDDVLFKCQWRSEQGSLREIGDVVFPCKAVSLSRNPSHADRYTLVCLLKTFHFGRTRRFAKAVCRLDRALRARGMRLTIRPHSTRFYDIYNATEKRRALLHAEVVKQRHLASCEE